MPPIGKQKPARRSPSTGDIDANELSLRERRIGFVFQHYAMFRHMTVLDNIASGLRARPTEHAILNKALSSKLEQSAKFLNVPSRVSSRTSKSIA